MKGFSEPFRAVFFVAVFLTLWCPQHGLAQDDNERDMELAGEAVLEARNLLRQGKYFEGMAAYEMAYRLFPDPNYLFALARIEARLPGERCKERISAWNRFLTACTDCSKRGEGKRALADAKHACAKPGGAGVPQVDGAAMTLNTILEKAEAHFQAGEFAAGAAAYGVLYSMKPKPNYLFMMAKGLSKIQSRCEEALRTWDRYLDACKSSGCAMAEEASENRAKVEKTCHMPPVAQPSSQGVAGDLSTSAETTSDTMSVAALAQVATGVTLSPALEDETGLSRQSTLLELGASLGHGVFGPYSRFEQSLVIGLERPLFSARLGWAYERGVLLRLGLQPHFQPEAFGVYGAVGFAHSLSTSLTVRSELNFVFFPGFFDVVKPIGLSLGGAYAF